VNGSRRHGGLAPFEPRHLTGHAKLPGSGSRNQRWRRGFPSFSWSPFLCWILF